MLFKVTKQFDTARESSPKDFMVKAEAEKYILDSLAEDMRFKIKNTSYRLYDDLDTLLKTYTQADINISQVENQAAGQAGRSSSFNPNPFATSPQPTGMPRSWIKDEDGDKDKK